MPINRERNWLIESQRRAKIAEIAHLSLKTIMGALSFDDVPSLRM